MQPDEWDWAKFSPRASYSSSLQSGVDDDMKYLLLLSVGNNNPTRRLNLRGEREKSWSALSWEPERAVSAYSRRACSLNTTRWVWRPVPNQAKPEAYFPSSIWLKEEVSLCLSCITSQTHHLFTWSHRGNAKYSQANLTSMKLNHV